MSETFTYIDPITGCEWLTEHGCRAFDWLGGRVLCFNLHVGDLIAGVLRDGSVLAGIYLGHDRDEMNDIIHFNVLTPMGLHQPVSVNEFDIRGLLRRASEDDLISAPTVAGQRADE